MPEFTGLREEKQWHKPQYKFQQGRGLACLETYNNRRKYKCLDSDSRMKEL